MCECVSECDTSKMIGRYYMVSWESKKEKRKGGEIQCLWG